jgi:hypothetical protein
MQGCVSQHDPGCGNNKGEPLSLPCPQPHRDSEMEAFHSADNIIGTIVHGYHHNGTYCIILWGTDTDLAGIIGA